MQNTITIVLAFLGAVLGVMNTWNAMSQRCVRLRVTTQFVLTMQGAPFGVSIEIINFSTFPLTIEEVGFKEKGRPRGRVALVKPYFPDRSTLPHRLEPREAISAMFNPSDFGAPPVRLGDVYARTACGRTISGNSPAGRQFSKMMAEWAEKHEQP